MLAELALKDSEELMGSATYALANIHTNEATKALRRILTASDVAVPVFIDIVKIDSNTRMRTTTISAFDEMIVWSSATNSCTTIRDYNGGLLKGPH
ncbi:MAG TPA: hypothetical protein VNN76_02800 [Bacteroidota bacterium]|nr:hypothetical protein [Bacteroidota bacterium]